MFEKRYNVNNLITLYQDRRLAQAVAATAATLIVLESNRERA